MLSYNNYVITNFSDTFIIIYEQNSESMLQCPNPKTTFPTAIIHFSNVVQTNFAEILQHIYIIFQHYSNVLQWKSWIFQRILQRSSGFEAPIFIVLKWDGLQIIIPLFEKCMVGVVFSIAS